MGKIYDGITYELARWLEAQPVFFVATAPSDPDTHANVSPRGWTRSAFWTRTASRGWTSRAAASKP